MKLYYVTFPDRDVLDDITTGLLDDGLVACVNAFPVGSTYLWQGEEERAGEVAAFLKTSDDAADALVERLQEEHPHDVPEILELPATPVDAYADWVDEETG
ncbi:MAG: divalent-cation tolerance protein CutA [Candidatus Nanohaloarchaea archaeon]